MDKDQNYAKDGLGWGALLWLFGYILGIMLFFVVPPHMIGWVLTPVATIFTVWVLIKKIKSSSFQYLVVIGIVWVILAVILD